jgi:hypothetical protein
MFGSCIVALRYLDLWLAVFGQHFVKTLTCGFALGCADLTALFSV